MLSGCIVDSSIILDHVGYRLDRPISRLCWDTTVDVKNKWQETIVEFFNFIIVLVEFDSFFFLAASR